MAGVLTTAERVPTADDLVGSAAPGSVPASGAGEPTRFALSATADIRVVADLLRCCRAALDAEGDVIVDCGEVERVDAAALQCLAALNGSLTEAGRSLTLTTPTTALRRAVEVLGFDTLLDVGPPRSSTPSG